MTAINNEEKRGMVRKQFLITARQNGYLQYCAEDSGESEGHFVREAIEEHASKRKYVPRKKQSATH